MKSEVDAENNNFLLLSLDDDNAKDVANVVGNVTCKQILNYLAIKESTQTDIAKELNLPMPTVHYNLQQLQKAGLVIWENYRLSEKGKEVRYYKLANKYIIIAPRSEKRESVMEKLRGVLPAFAFSIFGAFGIFVYYKLFAPNNMMNFESNIMAKSVVNDVDVGAGNGVEQVVPMMGQRTISPENTDMVGNSSGQMYDVMLTEEMVQDDFAADAVESQSFFDFDIMYFLNERYMWFLYGALFALFVVVIWRLFSFKKNKK